MRTGHREFYHESLAVTVGIGGDRFFLARGLPQGIAERVAIIGVDAEGGGEYTSLVPPTPMPRVEASLSQLRSVNDRTMAVWEFHVCVASSTILISAWVRP